MKYSRFSQFVFISLCLLFSNATLIAQVKICSWNIQHLGKTKNNVEINFMANVLKDFDIIALQELPGVLRVVRLIFGNLLIHYGVAFPWLCSLFMRYWPLLLEARHSHSL